MTNKEISDLTDNFINPVIEQTWEVRLINEFKAEYFRALKHFLIEEKRKYKVYPPGKLIFNAFNTTAFDKVKVVLLGQDPYHGKNQAHGLSFSVPEGVSIPPSLRNIYKELSEDMGIITPKCGNLTKWAEQGVFLINATLTVRDSQAGSHQNKGWETFTDAAIKALSEEREHLAFLLWGSYAQAKAQLIDSSKHLILKAPHPSPLSAYGGFFGCRHFSQANAFLISHGIEPIDWAL